MAVMRHKEAIHSGHFMVSDFEAEAEDEVEMALVSTVNMPVPSLLTSGVTADVAAVMAAAAAETGIRIICC